MKELWCKDDTLANGYSKTIVLLKDYCDSKTIVLLSHGEIKPNQTTNHWQYWKENIKCLEEKP